MKKIYLILSIAILALFISASGFLNRFAPVHRTSFEFKATSGKIVIEISYNPDQAAQVEAYIDSCLTPEVVFGDRHNVNKEVQIGSDLKYHIKGSPGSLTMKALKKDNSASSLTRIRHILEGLKSVIRTD